MNGRARLQWERIAYQGTFDGYLTRVLTRTRASESILIAGSQATVSRKLFSELAPGLSGSYPKASRTDFVFARYGGLTAYQ
jgi:hypothetical protein